MKVYMVCRSYFHVTHSYFYTFTGDKPQSQRTKILDDFRSGRSNIIVATDVAARGLGKQYCLINLTLSNRFCY